MTDQEFKRICEGGDALIEIITRIAIILACFKYFFFE